jgi:hypothetical protein
MPRRSVWMMVVAALGVLGAPASALGVSTISVGVDPPVIGARIAVAVTMASDDVGTKRAYVQGRVDDGRPCEPTLAAFTAATTASQARGFIESVAFAPGTTTVAAGPRGFPPGAVRVCGYLVGPSQAALAMSDAVVTFRLSVAALTMTVTPERPAFNQSLSVRVTGTTDMDATVRVYPGAGSCPRDVVAGGSFVTQGTVDVTLEDVPHPESTDRVCLLALPATSLAAPNDALVLAASEKPFAQELGGTIRLVSAKLYWRRVELVGDVTGTMPESAFSWEIRLPGGGEVPRCRGQVVPQRGEFTRRRGSRVVVSVKLVACPVTPRSILAGLSVETPLGARLTTDLQPIDLSETVRRNGLLVPDRSISGVTLGMTQAELELQEGAPLRAGAGSALGRAGIAPGFGRWRGARGFDFEGVEVVIRGGRVVAMASSAEFGTPFSERPLRTSGGITPKLRPTLARWRKAHPEARCVRRGQAVAACRLGRFTYIKPRPVKFTTGFFAIFRVTPLPKGGLGGRYVPLR